jgi:hypothetical protein
VTPANSLVGVPLGNLFGPVIVPVGSGAFAVAARQWDDPNTLAGNVGAVTYCNATTHWQGETPTAANSLVGSTPVGAATFCSGTTGCQGPITPANSYSGASIGDVLG